MHIDFIAKIAPTANMSGEEVTAVVITGLAVVFLVLVLLVIFVSIFGVFFNGKKKKENAKQPAPVAPAAPAKSAPVAEEVIAETDDNEVIAVISAVVAQMSLDDGKNYRISSVKPRNSRKSGRPVWAAEGLRQNTNPF